MSVNIFVYEGDRVKVTVGAPWLLAADPDSTAWLNQCLLEDPGTAGCIILEGQNSQTPDLAIFTEDPTAESRNVVFELVDETATCP